MPDPVLAEAERDVHELEQYVAVQHTRANDLRNAGRDDEERKAREGLLLLADALAIARQRLRAWPAQRAQHRTSTARLCPNAPLENACSRNCPAVRVAGSSPGPTANHPRSVR